MKEKASRVVNVTNKRYAARVLPLILERRLKDGPRA